MLARRVLYGASEPSLDWYFLNASLSCPTKLSPPGRRGQRLFPVAAESGEVSLDALCLQVGDEVGILYPKIRVQSMETARQMK